jgi:hypothetical protein
MAAWSTLGCAVTITARSTPSKSLAQWHVAQAVRRQLRYVGIVVAQLRAPRLQQLDDLERRGFAQVANARLVGRADDEDPRAPHGLAGVVERPLDRLQADVRHVLVDLAGELDELGREIVLARLPGEVERVDGEAVPAHARAGLEAHDRSARMTPASELAAASRGPRSGSRLRVSGVGTQTRIASASCSSTKRVVNADRSRTCCRRSEGMSSICDRPSLRPPIFPCSASTPITSQSASAKATASGRPT